LNCFISAGLRATDFKKKTISFQMVERALLLFKTKNQLGVE
jgi:hypothetical protein